MATWSISPNDNVINNNDGSFKFKKNTSGQDRVYTITYTDGGCTATQEYTVKSCQQTTTHKIVYKKSTYVLPWNESAVGADPDFWVADDGKVYSDIKVWFDYETYVDGVKDDSQTISTSTTLSHIEIKEGVNRTGERRTLSQTNAVIEYGDAPSVTFHPEQSAYKILVELVFDLKHEYVCDTYEWSAGTNNTITVDKDFGDKTSAMLIYGDLGASQDFTFHYVFTVENLDMYDNEHNLHQGQNTYNFRTLPQDKVLISSDVTVWSDFQPGEYCATRTSSPVGFKWCDFQMAFAYNLNDPRLSHPGTFYAVVGSPAPGGHYSAASLVELCGGECGGSYGEDCADNATVKIYAMANDGQSIFYNPSKGYVIDFRRDLTCTCTDPNSEAYYQNSGHGHVGPRR